MRRLGVGFANNPVWVVDGFNRPSWLDVDSIGVTQ